MRVIVTGATGFLGKHVVAELRRRGYEVIPWEHAGYDLTASKPNFIGTDAVVHCAARCGGIGRNQEEPAQMFSDNMRMGLNVLDACRVAKCRLVMIGTVCSYPGFISPPFGPERLWDGYPEPTNAPYGIAKRALIVAADAYRQQYGLDVVTVIPTNLYGPGDHFEPERSHVIPAMIRKFCEESTPTLWGDGLAWREFLYVEDAARGIVTALEKCDRSEPLNLGGGGHVSVKELAMMIRAACRPDESGPRVMMLWDHNKPNGQVDREVDWELAASLGWKPEVRLEDGLRRTVEAYRCRAL